MKKSGMILGCMLALVLAMGTMSQGAWVADGAVWSVQYGDNIAWQNAGGRRYTTFGSGASLFPGNLLDSDGNTIGAIGNYISASVGTTNNNVGTNNPGPGWAYMPTGIA